MQKYVYKLTIQIQNIEAFFACLFINFFKEALLCSP